MTTYSRRPLTGVGAAVLAATAALLACGPLLVIEVETEELCLDLGTQEVPGLAVGEQEVRHTLTLPIGRALQGMDLSRASGRLDFVGADIVAREGLGSFDWVERISADAHACGGSTRVLGYTRTPGATGTTLRVPGQGGLDVERLANARELELDVLFHGEPPTTSWSVDVRVCVRPRLKLDYGGMLLGGGPAGRGCPGSDGGRDGGEVADGGEDDPPPDGGTGDGGTCAGLRMACSAELACCGGAGEVTCGAGGVCCRPPRYVCGAGNLDCCNNCCAGATTCLVSGVCS